MGDDSLDKMDPYQRGSRIMSMYIVHNNYYSTSNLSNIITQVHIMIM